MKYIKHAEVGQSYSEGFSLIKLTLPVETKLLMASNSYATDKLKTTLIRGPLHER